jgi:hypothetical protein
MTQFSAILFSPKCYQQLQQQTPPLLQPMQQLNKTSSKGMVHATACTVRTAYALCGIVLRRQPIIPLPTRAECHSSIMSTGLPYSERMQVLNLALIFLVKHQQSRLFCIQSSGNDSQLLAAQI